MKRIHLVTLLAIICLASCSKEGTTENNLTTRFLIEHSPWIFDHYKIKEITEGENLDVTFLENEVNDSFLNYEIIFYEEGLGSSKNKSGNLTTFAWKFSGNTVTVFSGPNLEDTEYLNSIMVTPNQFTFESEFGSYDYNTDKITLHSGTYYFK